MEELGRLAFKGVADELECPSHHKKNGRHLPCAVVERRGQQGKQREENQRDAEGVAEAVHRMLVAAGVLGNPLFAGAVS